jgi:hypothetical protein
MPDLNKYAEWIVANPDKKGTEQYDTIATAYKDLRAQLIPPAPPQPEVGIGEAFGRGFERGKGRLGSTITDVIPALVGSAVGAEDYAQRQLQEAAEKQAALPAPVFESFRDVEGVGDFTKFVSETIGEQIPNLGVTLATALTGGAAAPALVGATRAAGQLAGAGLGSYALNAPEIFENIYRETGETAPGTSLLFGSAAAALDSVLPAALAKNLSGPMKVGITEKLLERSGMSRGALRAGTAGLAKGLGTEGLTEGAQEGISIAAERFIDDNPDVFGSNEFNRIMEASVRGAVAGGGFGTVGGGIGGAREGSARAQRLQELTEARKLRDELNKKGETAFDEYQQSFESSIKETEEQFKAQEEARTKEAAAKPTPAEEFAAAPAMGIAGLEAETLAGVERERAADEAFATEEQAVPTALEEVETTTPAAPSPAEEFAATPTMGIPQVEAEIATELEQERALKIPTTKEGLRKWGRENLGVGPTAAVIREDGPLAGKDLTDPAQAAEVRAILTDVKNASRSATVPVKVDTYLEQDVFKGLPEAPVTPQPKARPKPKVDTQPVEVTKQDEVAIQEAFPAAPVTPKPEIKAAPVTPPVATGVSLADQALAQVGESDSTLVDTREDTVVDEDTAVDEDVEYFVSAVSGVNSIMEVRPRGKGFTSILRTPARDGRPFIPESDSSKNHRAYSSVEKRAEQFNLVRSEAPKNEDKARFDRIAEETEVEEDVTEVEQPRARAVETDLEEETLEDKQMMKELGYDLKTPEYQGKALNEELAGIARRGNFKQLVSRLTPSQSPEIKRVLRKISSLGLTTKLVVAPTETGTSGSYDPNTNTITLDPNTGLNEHTFLHEATHAAVAQTLNDRNNPLTKQFFDFYSQIHTNIDGFYGGQDLQEFTAELVGNPEFQAYLKEIKAPKSQSLWQNIMDAIARFFGFRKGETAYNKGLEFVDQILDVSQGVEPSLTDKLFLGTPRMGVNAMNDLFSSGKDLTGKKKEDLLNGLSRLTNTEGGGTVISNAMRAMRLQDFIKLFGDKIPQLKLLQDAILGRQGLIEKGVKKAQDNYKAFKDLARELPAQIQKLTSIAHEARRDEIDLVGIDPEFKVNELNAEQKAKYNRLKNQFNQLDPRVREMYKTMRADYRAMYDRFRKYVEDQAQDKGQLAQLQEEFTRKTSAIGYVPFLRFGDYFVEYTSGGERYVEAFESPRERAKFIEANRSTMESEPELFNRPENGDYSAASFPDGSFAKRIMDVLPADQRGEVYQVILSLYPANSFMQRTRRAKLTKGEELDIVRGYGDTMLKWVRKQGNLEFLPEIQDNLRKIGDMRGTGLETAVRDEIGRRAAFIQSPHYGSGISFAATSAYNLFLLGNVSSAIVNLSSVPLLSLPLLSGQYGFGKSNSALLNAMKLANPFVKNRDTWKQDPKYKNLYEGLMDKAQLEHTMQREIVEGARQKTEDFDSFGAKVMNIASIPFSEGEKYSRAVTAIATYDLARAQGKSEQAAIDEAVSTVIDVHTSGMAAEGPQLMQDAFGGLGRVMFTFKSFIWNSAFVIGRAMKEAGMFKIAGIEGAQDAEAMRIARRQVLGIYGMSAAIAGVNGLPFFGAGATFVNIINSILGDEDEPFNAKEDMRLFVGELPYKGPLNYLTNLEISNRVGLANGLMFREDPYSLEQNGYLMTALAQATGPMGSYLQGVENVLVKDGRPELLLPSALRNVLKTGRYIQEGARTKDGAPIDTDINGYNLALQAFGFAPADISSLYENRAAAANFESKVEERKQKILKKYYLGITTGDSDTLSEALREYTDFTMQYPELINKDTLERSYRSQAAYQRDLIAGLRFDKRLRNKFLDTIDD